MKAIILIGIVMVMLVGCEKDNEVKNECEGMIPESCNCYDTNNGGRVCIGNKTEWTTFYPDDTP